MLGHEISHVANGDMVTLTLIQGVLNTFVMFLSRVVGYVIDRAVFKTERGVGLGYYISVLVLQIVFGILASAIVAWFSRQREFRADAGGAHLAGKRKMISALQRLKGAKNEADLPEAVRAFGIRGGKFSQMFATHPPLDVRIACAGSREHVDQVSGLLQKQKSPALPGFLLPVDCSSLCTSADSNTTSGSCTW